MFTSQGDVIDNNEPYWVALLIIRRASPSDKLISKNAISSLATSYNFQEHHLGTSYNFQEDYILPSDK